MIAFIEFCPLKPVSETIRSPPPDSKNRAGRVTDAVTHTGEATAIAKMRVWTHNQLLAKTACFQPKSQPTGPQGDPSGVPTPA